MIIDLRPWELSDAENLAKLLNNKKILKNLRDGIPFPYKQEHAREFIASMLQADRDKVFAFAVVADGQAVGSVGIFRQDNIHSRTAELGYYIGEPFWNKGIATEAIKKACNFIFETTDIQRIYAEPFARNKASCRVLEKAGFICEGILRANAVKEGVTEDMMMFAKIRTERL